MARDLVLDFSQITLSDLDRVGGKNASLGELFRELQPKGVRVVDGFATTADAYWRLLATSDLAERLQAAPTLILIGSRSTSPFVEPDCWLAAQNVMLAAPAMGLGTCCIGSALRAVNRPEIQVELGIPLDVRIAVAIVVGVPADEPAPTGRKKAQIVAWKKPPHGTEPSRTD
jgi:nitroreductase